MRVAIVDDEPLARRHLARLLEGRDGVHVVAVEGGGEAAVELIERGGVDLMFLDIRMPDVDGLTVAEHAVEKGILVVFTTAFDTHALEAFDLDAVDYLLKPFDRKRLDRAIDRALSRGRDAAVEAIAELREALDELRTQGEWLKRFVVKKKDRIFLLEPSEVEWIEAAGNYVKLHTERGNFHLRTSMRSLEQRLEPGLFLRIGRSAFVRSDAITELQKATHGDFWVLLKSGEKLTLSRNYRDRLAEFMVE